MIFKTCSVKEKCLMFSHLFSTFFEVNIYFYFIYLVNKNIFMYVGLYFTKKYKELCKKNVQISKNYKKKNVCSF